MRLFTISLWIDPTWASAFGKSWKRRRYWVARVPDQSAKARVLSIQLMDLTIKIIIYKRTG